MDYRSISIDRTLVTFEPKSDRLANVNGATRNVQVFKIYIHGISSNSHLTDKANMKTFFVPAESISADWTGGADLSCKLGTSSGSSGDETCIAWVPIICRTHFVTKLCIFKF